MIEVTHAFTMNGRIHGEVKDSLDSPAELIRRRLGLLDGVERYSLILWRIPEGIPFDLVDFDRWPEEYVQVAGSRERMTVEVRRAEDGVFRQYVIGRRTRSGLATSREVIAWNGCETEVRGNEVFDAREAAAVFEAYYATDGVPDTYQLRLLDL